MLEYDRIDVPERIEVIKTSGSRGCIICHYRYFSEINFRFDPKVCNCCHNLMKKAMCFYDVAKPNFDV